MSDKKGAPAWMVSFGDMMTLILTFFILLVSMSKTQQVGLVASGVGSFLVALRSFGLPGIMDDYEQATTFDNVRERFNLPPEDDPERRTEHMEASNLELIRAKAERALAPHDQISQPSIALFADDSAELNQGAQRYLDLLAMTLFPAASQVLLLEGHALDAGSEHANDNAWLAYARAEAVRTYLIEEHDFPPGRVEARAWLREIDPRGPATRSVDARLIIPERN
jgi:chemotaxis protein MotB